VQVGPLTVIDSLSEEPNCHTLAFTFDAAAYVEFTAALRQSPSSTVLPPLQTHLLYAPTFDHALKDPSPNALLILPSHRIIIIEGLYTFIDTPVWRAAAEILDERWLVEVDIPEATRRLVQRHVITGVAKDLDEAKWRADTNDMISESGPLS
jgi:pantothenate kinase